MDPRRDLRRQVTILRRLPADIPLDSGLRRGKRPGRIGARQRRPVIEAAATPSPFVRKHTGGMDVPPHQPLLGKEDFAYKISVAGWEYWYIEVIYSGFET